MRRFCVKIEVLVLVLVLSLVHHLEASRSKRQGGFVFDNSAGGNVEKCITKDGGQSGICIEIAKCDEATRILVNNPSREQRRFLQQRTCKFEGNTPFFCCVVESVAPPPTAPPATTTTTTAKPAPPAPPTPGPSSRQMSESDLNKVCGITKTTGIRVVGGTPAVLGAWPWMVAIFVGPSLTFVSCGGVLISEQYVLTASHCIIDKATGQKRKLTDYTIRLGDLDIEDDNEGATPIDLAAIELITHEDYNPTTIKNDIALIKLNQSVKITDLITPICLPSAPPMSNDLYVARTPYIAGWGTVEFRGESSSKLQQVQLKVGTNSDCQTAFTRFKVTISDTQLCAGFSLGGKDACQGDSGGPLMLANADNKWYTIGVVSVGFKCAEPGFPGIYTRTTAYTDWIKKNAHIQ